MKCWFFTQKVANCQARLLLFTDQISKLNSQSLHSETKGVELTLKSQHFFSAQLYRQSCTQRDKKKWTSGGVLHFCFLV